MKPHRTLLIAFVLALPWRSGAAQGPTLSLAQALDRAERHAYANRASRAVADASSTQSLAALRGVLPSVRFDAGFVRTTDPIGAFGTTLRQRTITAQDFDPARLNYPAVAANYSGAMIIEQPLFNADAWVGRRAALRAADAAAANAGWTASGTRVDVVRAYFGAIIAEAKVSTLQVAVRAAQEHVRQAAHMARNGLVTPSDEMLASVKAGEVEAMLLEAEGDAATAKLGLATALGVPSDTAFSVPAGLPEPNTTRTLARQSLADRESTVRDDVQAARAGEDAAAADALRARSLYLPRLNGFARYDWNSAQRLYGGQKNWTVGVMASWTPFAGASELADARATSARRDAAEAMREGAEARANIEREQTAHALRTALAKLEIAERSVAQSASAHRIVARRYAGGLAAVVELLDAAALETKTRLSLDAAHYAVITATAERLRALGLDPGAVRALDASAVARTTTEPHAGLEP